MRFWWRHRVAALWIVGSLGLTSGFATAAWSIAEAAWFRSLPGPESDRLMAVGFRSEQNKRWTSTSFAEYLDIRDRQDVFAGVASIGREDDWFLDGPDGPAVLNASRVTNNFFDVLGVAPMLGRSFTPADTEPGAPEVAIISFRLWRSVFGASTDVIHRHITVSIPSGGTKPVEIVAVLPSDAAVRCDGQDKDFFVSIPERWRGRPTGPRDGGDVSVYGRLRPNVSISDADSRLTTIVQGIDREHPLRNPVQPLSGPRTRTSFLLPLHEDWFGGSREMLRLLGTSVVLVMFVTGTNVLGVFFSLLSSRSREFGIRRALGEGRWHQIRSVLLELLPIALATGVLAVLVAQWGTTAFVAYAPAGIPRLADVRLNWQLMAMSVSLGAIAVALMGVIVAFVQTRRPPALAVLQAVASGSPRVLRLKRVLIATQVGLVLILVTAATLVTGSLQRLLSQPLGFDISHVLAAAVTTTQDTFLDEARYAQFLDDLRREVLAAPGQRDVAVTVDPPLGPGRNFTRVTFLDGRYRATETKSVSEGYFSVMGIPIIAGRDLTPSVRDCTLVVNASFAGTFLGSVPSAVGQQVILGGHECHVVGVSADVREGPLTQPMVPAIYPFFSSGRARRQIYVVTREKGPTTGQVRAVYLAIRRADPTAHVSVVPLSERRDSQTAPNRVGTIALGALSGFTLLLACLGIGATVAQVTAERQRELAIRFTLGASARSVVALITRVILWPLVCGMLLGCLVSFWTAPLLGTLLFRTNPFDALLWCTAGGVLVISASFATWIPARRVYAIDLVSLLRQE